jgi:hypothetical protein
MTHTFLASDSASGADNPPYPRLPMVWALDRESRTPRYIHQLDPVEQKGRRCDCVCPTCGSALEAVNGGKVEFEQIPHFRHPVGTVRSTCVIGAARVAVRAAIETTEYLVLPRRRRPGRVEGLSGRYFDAWVEREPERVRVARCQFEDPVSALLALDDGRYLKVRLVGRGKVSTVGGEARMLATIDLEVDDPTIAGMSLEALLPRLTLAWEDGCWQRHWNDDELSAAAFVRARQLAVDALDWVDEDGDLPANLTAVERRETLLHREAKAILEREKRIMLPGLVVEAKHRRKGGLVDMREHRQPMGLQQLEVVRLEVPMEASRPDVVAEWRTVNGDQRRLLIEITVTNAITPARVERLASLGFPVLEIDIGRMGGLVTRAEFEQLVLFEVAGKRWVHHPGIELIKADLVAVMKAEEDRIAAKTAQAEAYETMEPGQWAQQYLDAFAVRWDVQSLLEAKQLAEDSGEIEWEEGRMNEAKAALIHYQHPEARGLDLHPLRTIIARVLSIKLGYGVEYKYRTAWQVINSIRCDISDTAKTWHSVYLIAILVYAPTLTKEQALMVAEWRQTVLDDIRSGSQLYARPKAYDSLLSVLFPELRKNLSKPFGTIQHQGTHQL